MSEIVLPDRSLHVPDHSIVAPDPKRIVVPNADLVPSDRALSVAQKSIVSHPVVWRHINSPETEAHLRLILAFTLRLLAVFMDGVWAVDGSGMSANGHFRYRKNVAKRKAKANDADGPIYEEVGENETIGVADPNRADLTWRDVVDVKAGWKRVVLIAAYPFMAIGDVRVYDPSVGERSALKDMLTWLKSLDLPLREIIADGGFNGTICRKTIAEVGARAVIPYPENAKRAVKVGFEKLLYDWPDLAAMFEIWKNEPERFHGLYSKRAKIENVFSVIKNRWSKLRCPSGHGATNEMLMIAIVVNATRFFQLVYLTQHVSANRNVYPSTVTFT